MAVVIESLGRGGAEIMVAETARLLRPSFDLHVLALEPSYALADTLERQGVSVTRIDRDPRRSPVACLRRLFVILRRIDPDVVHTHLYYANVLGRLASRLLGIPVVSTLHNPDYTHEARSTLLFALRKRLDRWTGGRNAALMAVSRAVASDYRHHMGWTSIEVIHNGVDLGRFHPGEPAREALDAWPSEGARLLAVGRLHRQKGLDVLIRALAELHRRGVPAQLAVVGTGTLRASLEQLARDLDVERHVAWLGERDDVVDLLRAADVFAFPSRYEALGVALIEAMACGKAIVASAVGGIPEIVEHERTGLLVEPDNATDLAESLARTAASRELREALGRGALARASELSIERTAERVAAVYRRTARSPEGEAR